MSNYAETHKKNLAANDKIKSCCRDHTNHVTVTQADRQAEGHHAAASTDDHIYHTRCSICGCNHYVGISPVMSQEDTLRAQVEQYNEARRFLGLPVS